MGERAEGGSGERAAAMALESVAVAATAAGGEIEEGGSGERAAEMALQPAAGVTDGERAEGGGGERGAEMALESDAADADGGAVKRRRVEYGEGGGRREAAEDVNPDRISELPDDVLRLIIVLLPLKDAIRTTALSRKWRQLWTEKTIRFEVRPRAAPSVEGVIKALDVDGLHLDRLAVVVHTIMKSSHLREIIERAAACGVGDLHIELLNRTAEDKARFHFPILSRALGRLSLSHIVISKMTFKDDRYFDELAAIYFHSVTVESYVFRRVIMRCPNLRVLDLRRCSLLDAVAIPPGATKLSSLTIAGCDDLERVDVFSVPSLRSIFYSGHFISSFYLPRTRYATFTDLYVCYDGSILPQVFGKWSRDVLPKLSNLSNLTICSNSLEIVSSLPDPGRINQKKSAWFSFRRLTELQLLMFEMKASNLADIYAFLKTFHFPNLAKLFLQLPRIRDQERTIRLQSVSEETPEGRLDNLQVVRIMNFTRSRIEMQLVSFLLRKARYIRTLQLVSRSPNTIPLGALGSEGEDIYRDIQEALANGVIKSGESDDDATRPCHSEVFIEF